jgi:UDP-N-acetyl-D-mannosaminuronic acid dehydrogenase
MILISTVPPGSTMGWVRETIERENGFKLEKDYFLAYLPERVAPGSAISEVIRNRRIVGGAGWISTKLASKMIQIISPQTIETNAISAEVAKLAENASRDLNIAFVNQLATICERLGVDVLEVIRVANTHPRVRLLSPGPGVGGPCLTKDGYFLTADRKRVPYDLVEVSRAINDQMAMHVRAIALDAISKVGKKAEKCKVALLGVAYKANIDDIRESPSIRIIKEISHDVSAISVFDPHVKKIPGLNQVSSIRSCVKNADCLIIGTDHNEFRHLDLRRIMKDMNARPIIVDTRRMLNPEQAIRHGFVYVGVGYGHTKMDDADGI